MTIDGATEGRSNFRGAAIMAIAFFVAFLGTSVLASWAVESRSPDVVINGGFEIPIAEGTQGWGPIGAGSTVEVSAEGGSLRLTTGGTATSQRIALQPGSKTVLIFARMKAEGLVPGGADYEDARLAVSFLRADGSLAGYGDSPRLRQDSPWIRVVKLSEVPEGATQLILAPTLLCRATSVGFDDIVAVVNPTAAEVRLATALPPADAILPAGESAARAVAPVELTATRGEIPLAGTWKFAPVTGSTPPEVGWGFIRVPGSWKDEKALIARGGGTPWAEFDGRKASAGWYETAVQVPETWSGRRITLEFDRVSTDATVFVDGREQGVVSWPGGTVDLTSALTPGKSHQLRVLVVATLEQADVKVMMGMAPGQSYSVKAELHAAGLVGAVALRSQPIASRVASVAVRTSVRQKTLGLEIELEGNDRSGTANVVARILDKDGAEVRSFAGTIEATQTKTKLSWPWADPKLWDIGSPNLYTLELAVRGGGIDDVVRERFGFREFWIDGRKYMLNGVELRARTELVGGRDSPASRARLEAALQAGHNLVELWPHDILERSSAFRGWESYEAADEVGIGITGMMPHMGWMGGEVQSPERLARFTVAVANELRRNQNHPSVLMWGTSGNMFGGVQDPLLIGTRDASEAARLRRSPHMVEPVKRAELGINAIKKLDPSRPVFIHHGGASGDVYTLNHYLNMIPLQEREEYLSHYAEHGEMPLWFVEFGTPFYATMMRGRNNYGNAEKTEPFMTEYAASYLGSQSYRLESTTYREEIVRQFVAGQRYTGWHWTKSLKFDANFLKLQELFIRNTWRSYRTWGHGGGMIAWDDGYRSLDGEPTTAGDALREGEAPTLAWIAGKPGTFTDKTRNFPAGATGLKQLVLLNDTRKAQAYTASWRVTLGGAQIAKGEGSGTIEVARDLFLPISFPIPAELSSDKVDGEIVSEVTIGEATHRDSFPFRAFAKAPPIAAEFLVWDPAGKSLPMLTAAGAKLTKWDGSLSTKLPLIVGREAIGFDTNPPGDLAAFARAGGRILVLAQSPSVLTDGLDARVAALMSRRVFRVPGESPITRGLDDLDLRDWAGSGTLLKPKPDYEVDPGYRDMSPFTNFPLHGWRWGGRHTVSSAAIEKPHRSGWTPLIECEFDLQYTPLMELSLGSGRVLWSQLDLEDQYASDPAAARLVTQLLADLTTTPTSPRRPAVYSGGAGGRVLLGTVGLTFTDLKGIPLPGTILVVGEDSPLSGGDIESFAQAGGSVLILPRTSEQTFLGATFKLSAKVPPVSDTPDWPQSRGLSMSDLRTRVNLGGWTVQGAGLEVAAGGQLARRKHGDGVIVFCQFNANALPADTSTYLRLTRWRQTRTLAQLLANLGAGFEQDARLLAPPVRRTPEPVVELAGNWLAHAIQLLPSAASPATAHPDPGVSPEAQRWLADATSNPSDWVKGELPAELETLSPQWSAADGEFLFRRMFSVPPELRNRDLVLTLGALDDFDSVFINGQRVGGLSSTDGATWSILREYTVPAALLIDGENVITVRIWDGFGGGGFTTKQRSLLRLRLPGTSATLAAPGLYHPDYRTDFELGDDPYRYYNW